MSDHIQIGDLAPRVQYVGSGTETTFTYTFPIFKDTDLEVYIDGELQTHTSDYSIIGAGMSSGGEVTFITAPTADEKITLVRRLTIQRTSDFQASGEFRAKVINDELDYQTAALQQIEDDLGRAIRLKRDDAAATLELPLAVDRANKLIGFDANGNAQISNLTISEMESGATGPAGPTGLQGPQGNDGTFSGGEATVVPHLTDLLALKDVSDADAPKFATAENILGSIDLLTDDGANIDPAADWLIYFDASASAVRKLNPADIAGGGGLQSVQIFSASGTWPKPVGINLIKVTVVGGGGGGGTAGGGTNRANGGGGAGGAAIEWIDVSALGTTVSVTIGPGGAGAASGYSNGNAGSTSSFGSYCSATGGAGGETENTGGDGGQGGIGSGGDINISGGPGGSMGQTGDYTGGGFGGSSIFGGGGVGQGGNGNASGQSGRSPGGGGAGGHHTASAGNGAAGLVLIEEYA